MYFDDETYLSRRPEVYELLAALGTEGFAQHARAKKWIDKFRVEDENGAFKIAETFEKVGIPLAAAEEFDENELVARAYITGVNGDAEDFVNIPIKAHINPHNSPEHHKASAGHELGHFFLFQQGYLHDDAALKHLAERFCELFAQDFTLPLEYLQHIDTLDGATLLMLMELYGTSASTVLTQLARAGKSPRTVLLDVAIGESPNPVYSNRLTRIAFCYDCEIGLPHDDRIDEAPILDVIHTDLFRKVPFSSCFTDPLDSNLIAMVEREHGREPLA